MREYITPNWHAVLIHAPLGLLSIGIVIELFCLFWRRGSLKSAGRWMILLGAVTSVPALTSGLYAYRDALSPTVLTSEVAFDTTWDELQGGTLDDRTSSKETIKKITVKEFRESEGGKALWFHLLYNSIAIGGIFLAVVLFIASSDRWRKRLYFPLLLILVASKVLLVYGSHRGGVGVYMYGAALKPPIVTSTSGMKPSPEEHLKAYLPPAQVHMSLAGLVFGVSLIALALSIRAISEGPTVVTEEDGAWYQQPDALEASPARHHETGLPSEVVVGGPTTIKVTPATTPPPRRRGPGHPVTVSLETGEPFVPVATSRFWLIASLLAILTAVAGIWVINKWHWADLRESFNGENRFRYHTILGICIIVLPLILALVTRFARRNRVLLSVVSLLLFAAVGLQVWVGIMLTFDGPKGPKPMKDLMSPMRFNVDK